MIDKREGKILVIFAGMFEDALGNSLVWDQYI